MHKRELGYGLIMMNKQVITLASSTQYIKGRAYYLSYDTRRNIAMLMHGHTGRSKYMQKKRKYVHVDLVPFGTGLPITRSVCGL